MVTYENKTKPFSIILRKVNAYVRSYNSETEWMYFFIDDFDYRQKKFQKVKKKMMVMTLQIFMVKNS